MPVIINGTTGITDVNGTAAAPAITGTDTDTGIFFPAANTLAFSTGGTEDARFDASGNFGLGVTPSAWATLTGLQVKNAAMAATSNASYFGANWYYNAGDKYIASSGAAVYVQNAGGDSSHRWYNAPSGTAGNAITFTQAMTLDASGNLGVGTTSPTSRLHIAGDFASNKSDITLQNTGSSGRTWRIGDGVGGYSGSLVFFDATASAARMLLDSSGNLLVGQTAQTNLERFGVTQSGNGQVIYGYATDSSAYTQSVALLRGARNTTNATWSFLRCYNNADKLYIYDSGNVVNVNNSYGTLSDIKIKENITDATPKLADVMRLQVRNFNLKSDPDHKQIGFVAQELEQVFPSMVDESPDRDEEGNDLGTTTKSIKTSVLVPILVKAIQEQQSIIQSLTDRISALEGAKA